MFEFGASARRGIASPAGKRAVAAAASAAVPVFVSVNQVLVRLWTRASSDRSSDRSRLPPFGRMSDRELPLARLNALHSSGNGAPTVGGEGSEALRRIVPDGRSAIAQAIAVGPLRQDPVMCGVESSRIIPGLAGVCRPGMVSVHGEAAARGGDSGGRERGVSSIRRAFGGCLGTRRR